MSACCHNFSLMQNQSHFKFLCIVDWLFYCLVWWENQETPEAAVCSTSTCQSTDGHQSGDLSQGRLIQSLMDLGLKRRA